MNEIEFTVPGAPVGKGRPRAFRMGAGIRMHTPAKTASYENLVALSAQIAMAGRPPIAGPVSMDVQMVMPIPASWSKKKQTAAMGGDIRPTGKPDCDNVLKAIADACNEIVFADDKQVVDVRVRKFYGATPKAMVVVREVAL